MVVGVVGKKYEEDEGRMFCSLGSFFSFSVEFLD